MQGVAWMGVLLLTACGGTPASSSTGSDGGSTHDGTSDAGSGSNAGASGTFSMRGLLTIDATASATVGRSTQTTDGDLLTVVAALGPDAPVKSVELIAKLQTGGKYQAGSTYAGWASFDQITLSMVRPDGGYWSGHNDGSGGNGTDSTATITSIALRSSGYVYDSYDVHGTIDAIIPVLGDDGGYVDAHVTSTF